MPVRPFFALVCLFAAASLSAQQAAPPPLATTQPPPYWAFTANPPNAPAEPAGDAPQHLPNSTQSYTLTQIQDLFAVPDWHPDAHPPMPDVVAHGRKPEMFACAYCHLPNGLGRPENAGLAALPNAYIVQQMSDFQNGARKSALPDLLPVKLMVLVAAHATSDESTAAAAYFSQLPPKPWIKVIETTRVPKTHAAGWMLVPDEPHVLEPIGHRIIEVPVNLELTELRDDTSSFLAYVPKGSLKKGRFLAAKGGNGITLPCASCHGDDLRGKDNLPSIAGRSPSYIVRQLYDIQLGTRGGPGMAQMQPPVMKLSMDDMISIAAYLASLRP